MSWINRATTNLASILFFFILLELGSYAIWTVLDKQGVNKSGISFVLNLLNQKDVSTTMVPKPYSLYWNNPNFFDEQYGKIYNNDGYRSPETADYPSNAKRLLVLGGSTTNVWPYVKDNDKIWTTLVEKELNASSDTIFQVMNAGIPFGTTAELLSHYIFTGKYKNPDVVVYHGGGNDAMPLYFPEYQTDYSHVRWSQAGAPMRKKIRKVVSISYFAKLITSIAFNYSPSNGAPPYKNLNSSLVLERVKSNGAIAFKENLEVLINEARRNGSNVFLIGFLHAKKENLTRNRPDLIGLEDAIIEAVAKHDQIMSELAKKYSFVEFLKLDSTRFKDDWFIDNCHLIEEGEKEKALQISNFLKQYL